MKKISVLFLILSTTACGQFVDGPPALGGLLGGAGGAAIAGSACGGSNFACAIAGSMVGTAFGMMAGTEIRNQQKAVRPGIQ